MSQLALKTHQHRANRQSFLAINVTTFPQDPTGTLTLRNAFAGEMGKRFRELRGVIRRAIVNEDVFGLSNLVIPVTRLSINQMTTPGPKAFAFPRSQDKLSSFMEWLKQQEQAGILETTTLQQFGVGIEGEWTDKFIQSSYQKGIKDARQSMRNEGFDVPTIEASGGIQTVFGGPVHADRVGLLFTRTFNELQGITNAMDQQISRVLAQGLADGENPRVLARRLNKVIKGPSLELTDTLGRFIPAERRARILARTEIIRAHAEGTLQEFENFGVVGVEVRAEFVTAGDNRVCVECQGLEGQIFTIAEARGIIPVHPDCRCAWIPKSIN